MRFNQKGLIRVPSSKPGVARYVYGLHSIIKIGDIISFSSFGEGEMPLEVKLEICRYLGLEDPVCLGRSVPADRTESEEVA